MALPVATVARLAEAVSRAERGDAAARVEGAGLLAGLREAWPALTPGERDDLAGAVPRLKARLDDPAPDPPEPALGGDLDAVLRGMGVPGLRPGQDRAIVAALAGRDALVVMATGSGKSLCYQAPAQLLGGVTLVVSPLIALMNDQVAALRERGVAAVMVNSGQSAEEQRAARDDIAGGRARIVYAAPERLRSSAFVALLARRGVAVAAVDEAHCASEWGHDFRPDYRDLAELLRPVAPRSVMALTATATARVQDDIVRRLQLRAPARIVTGADRPNIAFDCVDVGGGTGLEARKRAAVARLVADCGDRPAVVYTRTRKAAEALADDLAARGVAAAPYHALRPDRRAVQEAFARGDVRVVCATNAFGMGVDVADIGLVVHHALPESVEAYSQEAGRAGRDGRPARAVLLFAVADIPSLRRRIQEAEITPAEVEARLRRLAASAGPGGEVDAPPDGDDRAAFETAMATRIGAFERAPGGARGGRVVMTRLGSAEREALAAEAAAEIGRRHRALRAVIDLASGPGCRRATLLRHFGDATPPAPSGRCCDVCDPFPVDALLADDGAARRGRRRPPARVETDDSAGVPVAQVLWDALRGWRSQRADGKPAYTVAPNRTLEEIARAMPATRADLERIHGVGPAFLERHAESLLELLSAHR